MTCIRDFNCFSENDLIFISQQPSERLNLICNLVNNLKISHQLTEKKIKAIIDFPALVQNVDKRYHFVPLSDADFKIMLLGLDKLTKLPEKKPRFWGNFFKESLIDLLGVENKNNYSSGLRK